MSKIITENINREFTSLRVGAQESASSVGERLPVPSLSHETAVLHRGVRKSAATGSDTNSRTDFLEPDIRNPLLSASNFYLPQSLLQLNAWIRYFDRFHPIVGNAIDMHATVPFSRFQLTGVSDEFVQQFYEDMADEMNLFRNLLYISREYELMGEAFPFLVWNDEMNAFDDMIIMNPDYIDVNGIKIGGKKGLRYEMVISEELRQFIMSDDPLDWPIIQDLDPAIVRAAESGLNAPLHEFNLSHIAHFQSPYDKRGTSRITGCLKDLMYEEKLREAQYAIAGGIVRPREIWKLGIRGEYMPTDGDLQDLRALIKSFEYDPNAAIISHHGLDVDFIGAERRLLPVIPELQEIEKRILTRLYVSQAMTHGTGPTYSNASVAMKVLDARYATKRDFLVDWMRNNIFLPVALANEFYKPVPREIVGHYRVKDRERVPMIPDFKWLSLVNLVEQERQIQYAVQLQQRSGVSLKTVCDLLQVSYDETKEYLRKEQGTVADPVWQEARKQSALAAARDAGESTETEGSGLFPEKQAPPAEEKEEKEEKEEDINKEVEDDAEKDEAEFEKNIEQIGKEEEEKEPKQPGEGLEPKTFSLDKKLFGGELAPQCISVKKKVD